MRLRVTEAVASLLEEAASCSSVPKDVRDSAAKLRGADGIPWDDLKSIVEAYRKASPSKPVYLHKLCSPGDVLLPSPPARERNPELVARLAKLQEQVDNKRYSDMVSDITEKERKADELRSGLLPTSRHQLTYGAHVLVAMFTCWSVAYYTTKWYLKWDERWAGMAGVVGLTAGLVVETLLLIIRSAEIVPLEERMPDLFDKHKVAAAYAAVAEMKKKEREAAKAGRGKGKGQGKGDGKGKAGAEAAPVESKKAR
ncbi:hypothetical protein HYH03_001041 [Edaphochlamys debaryana]|uniref:Uncharacterized protein n=1 Tax=Edaphochlamys debaryana TaxID=47281 RepID=A0A836C6T1_9CHLO|nr:hypothetical protein HYH03_001041 [Edaphochlamys debaryana]|eukprot:KAG2501234.1 hypothetical protein HYH03_001041 [Edaphochlamys debaryana]